MDSGPDVPGDVLMIKVGDRLLLSLWDRGRLRGRGRADPPRRGPRADHPGPQRAHPRRGRCVLEDRARPRAPTPAKPSSASGAVTPATSATRPAIRWEIAYNPGPIGQAVLP